MSSIKTRRSRRLASKPRIDYSIEWYSEYEDEIGSDYENDYISDSDSESIESSESSESTESSGSVEVLNPIIKTNTKKRSLDDRFVENKKPKIDASKISISRGSSVSDIHDTPDTQSVVSSYPSEIANDGKAKTQHQRRYWFNEVNNPINFNKVYILLDDTQLVLYNKIVSDRDAMLKINSTLKFPRVICVNGERDIPLKSNHNVETYSGNMYHCMKLTNFTDVWFDGISGPNIDEDIDDYTHRTKTNTILSKIFEKKSLNEGIFMLNYNNARHNAQKKIDEFLEPIFKKLKPNLCATIPEEYKHLISTEEADCKRESPTIYNVFSYGQHKCVYYYYTTSQQRMICAIFHLSNIS